MKISKLLVLTALWLGMGASAMAAIVDGVRQKPAPSKTQGFVVSETTDTYFYLYNVDAKAFFTEGNAWGTQVSLGEKGLKVAFTIDGSYDLAYLFNDYSIAKNSWQLTFFDTENQMFVDLGKQANYRWGVEDNGETFRLYAASEENGNPGWDASTDAETGETIEHPAYREGQYMGWKAGSTSTACVPYLPVEEGNCINWALVTEEVYAAYAAEMEVYAAAEKLKTLLNEADEIGANVADQLAVYSNPDATAAELNAACTAAQTAIDKRKQEIIDESYDNATVANPVVVTDKFLKNYDFVGNKYDYWLGSSFGQYNGKDNAERYAMTYDTYQDVNGGMKVGVYAIGVNAFYRAGYAQDAWNNYKAGNAQSKYAKLYGRVGQLKANNYIDRESSIVSPCVAMITDKSGFEGDWSSCEDTDEEGNVVTYYIPNNMVAAEYAMHTLGQYANKVLVAVMSETDTLRVGVRKSTTIDGDWSIFDDFSLTYYGAGADACKLYLDEAMKAYGNYAIAEGTTYTESYLTAYKAAYEGEKPANSLAEVNAILATIDETKTALDKNIELWKTYKKKVEDSFAKYCQSSEYDFCISTGDLGDYVDMDIKTVDDEEYPGYKTICSEHKLTNEELEAEIAFIDALCDQIDKEAKEGLKEGDDVTRFIKNADFEMCDVNTKTGEAPYWTVKKDVGNVTAGPLGQGNYDLMVGALGKMNYCFESWHSHDFDVYQEVNNVPEGVYVIEAQGFVRCENKGYNRPDDVDKASIPVHLYLNNATDVFPNVYSELAADLGHEYTTVESWTTEDQGGNLYPNSMGGAAQCFGWGMYKMQTFGLVKEGETMRIGVKGKMKTDDTENWWCIWDNFKLTFQGYNVTYVKPALDLAMENIDISKPMGKKVYDTAKGLTDKYNDAVATGDGKTMFQMLADVYDATAAISSSVELFAELYSANEALNEATYLSKNTAAIAEARTLYDTIANGILNHEYDDADVEGLMNQIAAARTKLGFPNDWENASDDNPKDFTGVIVNPAYDEGIDGWSGTAAAYGSGYQNAEIFGSNFDYYQDIEGLPAGTYQVTVQGFYRAGGAADDYKAYKENPELLNHAFIYAMTSLNGDTAIASKPMKRLAAEAASESEVGSPTDGYVYAAKETEEGAGDGWIVPNTMDAAGAEFEQAKYLNEGVTFKLTEGAKLRIGLKKNVNITDNWTLFDNWQLTYFGKNSGKTADDDASGINTINEPVQVKIEYFTLDGRKTTRAQKGILIQKMTLGNGATIVRKIQK